jgi:hypothetical protein
MHGRRVPMGEHSMHSTQHCFETAIGALDAEAASKPWWWCFPGLVALSKLGSLGIWPRECARASCQGPPKRPSGVIPPVVFVFVCVFLACRALLPLCTATPEPELLVMALLFILISLLLSVLLSVVFFPAIVRFLGQQVGRYLRQSCRTRRELLLARVATESKNYETQHAEVEDHDWEEIASVATDGRVGNKQDKQWEGIVGFFHPFWYR